MQTIQQFAKSKNVSIPVVEKWMYRHGLPVIKIGRRNYICEEDFVNWVKSHKQVFAEKPKEKSFEIAIPQRCRKSSIASKIRKIY